MSMGRRIKQLRKEIRAERLRGWELMKRIGESDSGVFGESGEECEKVGYDEMDVFFNSLLDVGEMPVPIVELERDMVEYYKTPARVVVELAARMVFGPEDVFYDLGSGLGQVVLLVHLLTGMAARGVEIEPAYCGYARKCVKRLGLSGVEFVAGDARDADLSAGTVFFLFTPFKGEVFCQVMGRLKALAVGRRIRVIGYGPCSAEIERLDWLRREGDGGDRETGTSGVYSLQIFSNSHEDN
jgi:SAM-dependent methyltransferase